MKRLYKIVAVVAIVAAAGMTAYNNAQNDELQMSSLAINNVEAIAWGESDSDCPNGCYDNGGGCFCHYWFPTYREAN